MFCMTFHRVKFCFCLLSLGHFLQGAGCLDRHLSDGCCGASADFQPVPNHNNDLRPCLEIGYRHSKLTLPPLDNWVGGGPFKFELGQSVLLHSLAHSAMSLLIGDYALNPPRLSGCMTLSQTPIGWSNSDMKMFPSGAKPRTRHSPTREPRAVLGHPSAFRSASAMARQPMVWLVKWKLH